MTFAGAVAGESSRGSSDGAELGRGLKIMAFPKHGNSYVDCFYPAMEKLGASVQAGDFSLRWLMDHLRSVDYVHLHWPSFLYRGKTAGETVSGFGRFLFFLGLIRRRGVRLAWTVHNLYPHDPCPLPGIDWTARRALIRTGSLFLIHGPSAEKAALREFPAMRGRTQLIEHGHWIDYYPNSITRLEARSRLGLDPGDTVFLFFGLCKPYKGLEELIRTFERLPGNPVLLIAGKFQSTEYEAQIRALVGRSPRIHLFSGVVPTDEVQVYLKACDIMVVPYTKILTSGSVVLAMSFGRPVIAPAFGSVKDTVREGCGILYDAAQPDGLARSMHAAISARFDESHILQEISRYTWHHSAWLAYDRMRRLLAQTA
jgi:beta-1,4-mannosyltransferase